MTETKGGGLGRVIGIWIVTLILLVMIGGPGVSKYQQPEVWSQRFIEIWSLPAWLVPISGGMEVVGALLLLSRRTATYGSVLLIAVMLGATGAHIGAGEWNRIALTLALAGLAVLVGYLRLPDAMGPLRRD